jgi:hypothetical protein
VSRKPPIVDAEFEVVTEADREVARPEAWQVETGKSIPAFGSWKARGRQYLWTFARALGAPDDILDGPIVGLAVYAIGMSAFFVALFGVLMWVKTTFINNPPA